MFVFVVAIALNTTFIVETRIINLLPEPAPAAVMEGGGATETSGMGNEDTGMGHQHT